MKTKIIVDIAKLIRPHQWIKSAFVFIGVVFGHYWLDWSYVSKAVFASVAFSFVASGVYILNDIRDLEQDRAHPKKRNRPLASGRLSLRMAFVLLVLLWLLGFFLGGYVSWVVAALLLAYVVLNVAYSFGLKHIVILDVFMISAGFMLRILVGTTGLGIEPSHWLLFCGLMVTLFLGFAKRRAELLRQAAKAKGATTRQVLEHYNAALLDLFIGISLACVIMSYSLYTVSPETIKKHGTAHLIYTVPFVVYACFRYMYLLHEKGGGEDTARDLVRDPHILVSVFLWGLSTLALMAHSELGL